jgi:hypothetical protein
MKRLSSDFNLGFNRVKEATQQKGLKVQAFPIRFAVPSHSLRIRVFFS